MTENAQNAHNILPVESALKGLLHPAQGKLTSAIINSLLRVLNRTVGSLWSTMGCYTTDKILQIVQLRL